jgi:hypothetical protein
VAVRGAVDDGWPDFFALYGPEYAQFGGIGYPPDTWEEEKEEREVVTASGVEGEGGLDGRLGGGEGEGGGGIESRIASRIVERVRKKVLRKKEKKDGETRTNSRTNWHVAASGVIPVSSMSKAQRFNIHLRGASRFGTVGGGGWVGAGGLGQRGGGAGENKFSLENLRPDVVDSLCWEQVGSRAQVEEGGVDGGVGGRGGCVLAGRWWLKAGVAGRFDALTFEHASDGMEPCPHTQQILKSRVFLFYFIR